MKRYIYVLVFVFYAEVSFSQITDQLFFGTGARVCFVGNSITNNGEFHHNLLLYHITRFPDRPVNFYNCGISGDNTGGVLNRMDDDILIRRPTHAVIMLGMNDVQRSLYGEKKTMNPDTLKRRDEAIRLYKVNLEKIISVFLSKNISVILEKPTIYDQTANLAAENNFGVNDALKTCADFIGELALKYGLRTIDYWTIMEQVNLKMQSKDPSVTLTGPDRIHPASTGHLVMTYQFLKSEHAPKYVSKISIGKNKKTSAEKSEYCEIISFLKHKNGVTFAVKENSLPFPTIDSQDKGLELIPFTDELNVELLKVGDLKKGQYHLDIDGKIIGSFSNEQFNAGINLSEFRNTPQYLQALKVRDKLTELWKMEASLRGIKFIECNSYFKDFKDKKNPDALKTYLDAVFTQKYGIHANYYKIQLERYISNKPKEGEFEKASDLLREEVYHLAQTRGHIFSITSM